MKARANVAGDPIHTGPEVPDRGGISAQMGRVVDGFGRLVSHHIQLARLELAEEARAVGREVLVLASFAPLLLVGYVLVCVAAALLLGRWMGQEVGFLLVGALNLVIGGLGSWRAAIALRRRPPLLRQSKDEIHLSAAVLGRGARAPERKELQDGRRE